MGIPTGGDVSAHEVNGWVQDQAQFLAPTRLLVLWCLSANAFYTSDNPEGRAPGDVLSGRCAIHKICVRTGLSERAVRDSLRDLQDAGYIVADHKPGNGHSRVTVFWGDLYDEMRSEFRSGLKALPRGFQRTVKKQQKPRAVSEDAVVLPFRTGK